MLEGFIVIELWFYEATTKRGGIQFLAGRFKDRRPEGGISQCTLLETAKFTRWRLGTKSKSVSDLAGSEAGFLEAVDAASIVAYYCRSFRYAEISNTIKKMD